MNPVLEKIVMDAAPMPLSDQEERIFLNELRAAVQFVQGSTPCPETIRRERPHEG